MFKITTFLLSLACVCQVASAAVPTKNVRPDFQDPSASQAIGATVSGGFIMFHMESNAPGAGASTGSGVAQVFLSQSTYGHPFAVTQSDPVGSQFVQNILRNDAKTGVYDKLYPAGYRTATGVTASRIEIDNAVTGGAFRYRWLMYGAGGADASGNPVILNLFAQTFQGKSDASNPWFGDDERRMAQEQIAVLRGALATAPLNAELQQSLLDIYYDLAVAEMQFATKRLAKLATIRLGLDSSATQFVIDKEIAVYKELIQVTGQAVAWYSELLCFEMGGVNPGDYSPEFEGAPYGHFLFKSRVPSRAQADTELGYATDFTPRVFTAVNGVATIVLPGTNNDFTITAATPYPKNFRVLISEGLTSPSAGTDTLSIPVTSGGTTISSIKTKFETQTDLKDIFTLVYSSGNDGSGTGSTTAGTVEQILSPTSGSPVFAGYKDYRTFLTILGQLIQYKQSLAELLAKSSTAGAGTEARQLLTEIAGTDTNTYQQLLDFFPNTDFSRNGDLIDTGVNAAQTLVKVALADAVGVSSFVNGTGNPVGLDKNFLLLVQKQNNETAFDSYDLLQGRISQPGGALQAALAALGDPNNELTGGGAIQSYSNFLGSVSEVATDLLEIEIQFGVRFEEITGYPWNGGDNAWDGQNPAPGIIGSDLATANRTLAGLKEQNDLLDQDLALGRENVLRANSAVAIAEGIKDDIINAQEKYLTDSDKAYDDLAVSNAKAAAAQVVYDAGTAALSLDGLISFNAFGIGVLGVVNRNTQAEEAKKSVFFQQDIDNVAIQHDTSLALAGQSLTVQQSLLEIGKSQREVLTTELQLKSNFSAFAQAVADRAALLREVVRIEDNFEARRGDLASAYYADPIHYQRAEAALIVADGSFKRAQRWVFMTARALEYKWQEDFIYVNAQTGLTDSIASIFQARNAFELDRISQGMIFFNQDRLQSPGERRDDTATISLLTDVLTPNPADIDLKFGAFPPDEELRYNPDTGAVVSRVARFREILNDLRIGNSAGGGFNPKITIPIDSTLIEKGQLFAGPKYSYDDINDPDKLTGIESGLYRDKIVWLAVHFVFNKNQMENGETVLVNGDPVPVMVNSRTVPEIPGNNGITGSMTYAGNTFFRKRIPPYPNRSPVQLVNAADATIPDSTAVEGVPKTPLARSGESGEFDINPFRFFQNTDPTTRIFETFDRKNAPSLEFIFSSQSAELPDVENKITGTSGFQISDFRELSVATTGLVLTIDANQFRLEDLLDIEIVIQHVAYVRPMVRLPASQ